MPNQELLALLDYKITDLRKLREGVKQIRQAAMALEEKIGQLEQRTEMTKESIETLVSAEQIK